MTQELPAIGIDFGTSTSLVAVYWHGAAHVPGDPFALNGRENKWTPSLVAQWKGEGSRLLVGWKAWRAADTLKVVRGVKLALGDPKQKFELCGESYSASEVAAIILLHLRLNAERMLERPVRDVVLSIPANFGGAAREALMAASKIAGLNTLRLINEPTAAALAYTLENPTSRENILVFDFGGGTLDITTLRKEGRSLRVRSTHGDPKLGGAKFDEHLRELIRKRMYALHGKFEERADLNSILLERAEVAKWELSRAASTNIADSYIGHKAGKEVPLYLTLTRSDLNEACRPLLDKARACLLEAVRQSGLRPEELDRVLLVGGTTQIPAVQQLVREVTGDKCLVYDSMMAVAEGAAIMAAHVQGRLDNGRGLELRDVTSHGLGIKCRKSGPDGKQVWYGCLVAPNSEIPFATRRDDFSLPDPAATALSVPLYEGYAYEDRPLDATFKLIREEQVGDIPPSENGEPRRVSIEFRYNENAIVEVKASVAGTGKVLPLVYDPRVAQREIEASAARAKALWRLADLEEPSPPPPPRKPEKAESAGAPTPPVAQPPTLITKQAAEPAQPPGANGNAPQNGQLDARLDSLIAGAAEFKTTPAWRGTPPALRQAVKDLLVKATLARENGSEAEKVEAADALQRIVGR